MVLLPRRGRKETSLPGHARCGVAAFPGDRTGRHPANTTTSTVVKVR